MLEICINWINLNILYSWQLVSLQEDMFPEKQLVHTVYMQMVSNNIHQLVDSIVGHFNYFIFQYFRLLVCQLEALVQEESHTDTSPEAGTDDLQYIIWLLCQNKNVC